MKNKQNSNNSAGFTLIELGVVNVLLIMVVVATTVFWQYLQKDYQFSFSQYQLTEQTNQVLRQLTTEIRQAEIAMDGAYPLAVLDDNELAFYADINNDGLVKRYRYFVEDGSLKKGLIIPTGNPPTYVMDSEKISVILENIDESKLPLFYYYNGNWPGDSVNNPLGYWTRPLEARLIRIVIPLLIHAPDRDYSYESSSVVHIRNLKSNL